MEQSEVFAAMKQAVVDGDRDRTVDLAQTSLAMGVDPQKALDEGLVAGILEVGEGFASGELFIPDLICGGNAVKAGADVLRAAMEEAGCQQAARASVLVGTAAGDIHDLGKSLVATMFTAGGFEVIDLGVDVKPEQFVEAAVRNRPDVVGISALLTSSMPQQRATIEAFEQAGLRDQVRILVGGAPVNQAWADEIGADGYAPDAAAAVAVGRRLLGA